MSFRLKLCLVTLLLLLAASLRIIGLTSLPPGFSDEEVIDIRIVETVRTGRLASFYNVGEGGREGLYAIIEAAIVGWNGLLSYRIFSVWCGLISVALAYTLGRRLFSTFVGFVSGVMMAVAFWPIILSRSAIHETLLLPFTLGMILTLAHALHLRRTIEPDPPKTFHYTLVGVFAAAMAYTHWTGLMVAPFIVLYILYLIYSRQPISRRVIGSTFFTLLVAVILGIPYLTFTLRSFQLSGFATFWSNRPESVGDLIFSTLKTFASIFLYGDPRMEHNLPGYPLIGPIGSILFLIGLFTAIRRWRNPNKMLILLALVIGLLPGAWSKDAPNFTNIILALPSIVVLVGIGARTVAQQIWKPTRQPANLLANRQVALITIGLALISAGVGAYYLFGMWASMPEIEKTYHATLGRLASYLDRTHDDLTTSICTFNLESMEGKGISDPALLRLMMHRETTADDKLRFSDCINALTFTKGGERQRLAFASPEMREAFSPFFSGWIENARSVDTSGLILEFDVSQQIADAFGTLTLGTVSWSPETTGISQNAQLPVRMGGYLTFEGYQLIPNRTFSPGEVVTVITYWRADGEQVPDLRLFMHLLRNPNVEPILQNDVLRVDPALLQDRDVFIQIISIPLPAEFPPGEYFLSIGAYQAVTGERLPVYDHDQPRGDRLFLDTIEVE